MTKRVAFLIILFLAIQRIGTAILPDRDTSGIDLKYLRLEITASDTSAYIQGKATWYLVFSDAVNKIHLELSEKYSIDSVAFNGEKVAYTRQNSLLTLEGFAPSAGGKNELCVVYHGNAGGKGFFSGISNRTDGLWKVPVTWTLSEPFSAREWFPAKQVLTDKIDSSDVLISVPPWCLAGSNGLLTSVDTLENGNLRFFWKSRYPIAYYLISFAVARYRDYTFYAHPAGMTDSLPVQNYIYNVPNVLETYQNDIDRTKDFIELYASLLNGYPFPEEKYGHCLAPMGGGMEHQTMTTLSSFNFSMVAHELMHMWFGDMVTCASWSDIWLNEGFASYGEYLAYEYLENKNAATLWMSQAHMMAFTMPNGSVYVPPEETNNEFRIFNYNLSYKKGAALVHMLRYETGNDSLFFEILRRYLHRHAYSTAAVDNFKAVAEEVTGRNYDVFFNQWYYGQGYPVVQISWLQTGQNLSLQVTQEGSSPKTPLFSFLLPVKIFHSAGDTTVYLKLESGNHNFSVRVPYPVTSLKANPDFDVLAKTTIYQMDTSGRYLSIYPNPSGEQITVSFYNKAAGERTIMIVDAAGKVIKKQKTSADTLTLDVNSWNSGVYVLLVSEGSQSYSSRFVVH